MREITYLEAVREAMTQEMERDERVFLMGEDIARHGGAFGGHGLFLDHRSKGGGGSRGCPSGILPGHRPAAESL